jgi:hypothetical protein
MRDETGVLGGECGYVLGGWKVLWERKENLLTMGDKFSGLQRLARRTDSQPAHRASPAAAPQSQPAIRGCLFGHSRLLRAPSDGQDPAAIVAPLLMTPCPSRKFHHPQLTRNRRVPRTSGPSTILLSRRLSEISLSQAKSLMSHALCMC